MKDLINNGKNGYLIENNDIDDFVDKVKKIYNSNIFFKKENFDIEKYTVDNVSKEIKKIYNL